VAWARRHVYQATEGLVNRNGKTASHRWAVHILLRSGPVLAGRTSDSAFCATTDLSGKGRPKLFELPRAIALSLRLLLEKRRAQAKSITSAFFSSAIFA